MAESQVVNVDFKLISLNVRGIRDLSKRKAILSWMKNKRPISPFSRKRIVP